MKRLTVVLVASMLGVGCLDGMFSTSASSPVAIVIDDNQSGSGGGCSTCPGDKSCAASPVTCTRVELSGGQASAFTIAHGCTAASTIVTCTRAGDGLTATFGAVVSGASLDPGPPGAGGGVWSCIVFGSGSCVVTLDT